MHVTTVIDGRSAIAALQTAVQSNNPFALVLLDGNMPGMDGFQVLEEVRSIRSICDTTIMMLTSAERPDDAQRCKKLGVAQYLIKPVAQRELRQAIVRLLSRSSSALIAAKPPEATPVAAASGKIVLLAEDNLVNQKVAVKLISGFGHNVRVANNGAEAIKLFEQESFDIVFMDVQMPEVDGFEATRRIRELQAVTGSFVPIIAMTAHAMKGDRERCLEAGMDDYLAKPIDRTELRRVVDKWMGVPGMIEAGAKIEGRDLASLAKGLGVDEETMAELVEVFRDEAAGLMQRLKSAINENNARELRAAAHSLKGAIAIFGAPQAFQAAEQLEHAQEEPQSPKIARTFDTLRRELDAVLLSFSAAAK